LGSHWLSLYGPDTDHAFGHLGLSNILAWADPEREVAAAIVTSGKPLFYPGMYYGYALVRAIGATCAKVPPRKALGRTRLPRQTPHARPAASRGPLRQVAS
jgi:CubicO group peptidase (beta-lactamase class C family)